jgi:hypothetical protein
LPADAGRLSHIYLRDLELLALTFEPLSRKLAAIDRGNDAIADFRVESYKELRDPMVEPHQELPPLPYYVPNLSGHETLIQFSDLIPV